MFAVAPLAASVPSTRLLAGVARLTVCTTRAALAARLADLLADLTSATIVGVRIGLDEAWRSEPGTGDALVRSLVAIDDLDAALHSGLVFDLGPSSGVACALAGGIDAGIDAPPGLVLVAGDGVDADIDGPVVAAVLPIVAGMLAHLERGDRLEATAETDPATGFANRAGLERAIAAAGGRGARVGLVDLHLGGVTELAAAFGAGAARGVLRAVGERLLVLPLVLAVASTSADGLAVVVTGDEGAAADQLVAAAAAGVTVGRQNVCLDVRAGAAGATGFVDPRALVERAALARLQTVSTGATVVVHSDALTAGCHERLDTAGRLRRALDEGGHALVVHYQPQTDAGGRILGLEALVRWDQADGTMTSPDRFLPVAEQAGMMADLDLHVLRSSCRQLEAWSSSGIDGFRLAVNLSASTVARPGIGAVILGILEEVGIDPRRLELEITETTASDEDGWVQTLEQLRAVGVSVAMDDFGTGYSSLGRIHRVPLDRLKIDRSFVADLAGAGATVAAAVVALAAGLGLDVLAEGVEDHAQVAALVALGCHQFQGYVFARPMPATAVTALLVDGACR